MVVVVVVVVRGSCLVAAAVSSHHHAEQRQPYLLCKQGQGYQCLQEVTNGPAGAAVVHQARPADDDARLVAQAGACVRACMREEVQVRGSLPAAAAGVVLRCCYAPVSLISTRQPFVSFSSRRSREAS